MLEVTSLILEKPKLGNQINNNNSKREPIQKTAP
jgi:hypothetical protein